MADIDKITASNGTTYNIRDSVARESISQIITPEVLFHYTEDGEWAPGGTKDLGTSESFGLYAVFTQGGVTPMIGVAGAVGGGGWALRCSGNYDNGTLQTTYGASFTISAGGVWTLAACGYQGHTPSGSHGARVSQNVGYVIRLL